MRLLPFTFIVVLLQAVAIAQPAPTTSSQPASDDVLVFTSFRDNGQDGLHLAWSENGFDWKPLNGGKSLLTPTVGGRIMRDPCMIRTPDGTFHLTWTTGWSRPLLIGYATSRDLRHWTEQRGIPAMQNEPKARNLWAPEVFYDESAKRFLLFWSSTIPGRYPETDHTGDDGYNHRAYYTVTRDFKTFESSQLLFDGGFNCIDATMLKLDGRYCLIVKDETLKPVRKHLRLAFGDTPVGPWKELSEPFTTSWVEGPSAVRIGGYLYVYFDHYADPPYYGAVRSQDLKHWEDVSKQMHFPPGHRHGTVLRVPRSIVEPLTRSE